MRETLPFKSAEFVITSAALALALVLIFAPWRATDLELRDFSEFLPLLESHATFGAGWEALNDYYRTQGRGNVLTTGLISAGFQAAGKSPVLWQSYELLFLIALAIALYALLRALGVGRVIAAGLALWTACSGGPAAGALRINAELQISLLLVALILISRDRLLRSPVPRAIVIATLTGAMLLFKEAAIVFVPLVVGAIMAGRGSLPLKLSGVAAASAAAVLVLIRALAIAGQAPPDAYSQGLSAQHVNVFTVVAAARLMSPDHWPWMSAIEPLTSLATAAWLAVIVVGCVCSIRRGGGFQVAGLSLTCIAGLGLYAAWGRFESFYAAPFVVAQAATAGAGLVNRRRRDAWIPLVASVIIAVGALHAAAGAWRLREWTVARRAVEFEAAERLSRLGADREATIVEAGQPLQKWQGNAATLSRFIRSMWPDRPVPSMIDARCSELELTNGAARAIIVYDRNGCERAPVTGFIRRDFTVIAVLPPAVIRDAYFLGITGLE